MLMGQGASRSGLAWCVPFGELWFYNPLASLREALVKTVTSKLRLSGLGWCEDPRSTSGPE
jgi:hypothetical protein